MPLYKDDRKQAIPPFILDKAAFKRVAEALPALGRLLDEGKQVYRPFEEAIQDTFTGLKRSSATTRPKEQMERGYEHNHSLIEGLLADSQYQSTRTNCDSDETLAAVAAKTFAESILSGLGNRPPEELEKINRHHDLEQDIEKLLQMMEAYKQLQHSEGASLGKTEDEIEKNLKNDEALKSLEDQLAEKESELRVLENETQEGFFEDFDSVLRHLGRKAADEAQEATKEAKVLLDTWGTQAGDFRRQPAEEQLRLLNAISAEVDLKKILELVGKLHDLAGKEKKQFGSTTFRPERVTFGRDILHVVPHELANKVVCPTLFNVRLATGQLMVYSPKPQKGKGPIVICVDFSGSMDQPRARIILAKALVLALQAVAKDEGRDVHVVTFTGDLGPEFSWEKGEAKTESLMQFLEMAPSGGTVFEKPLNRASELISSKPELRDADVVFITDGCSVPNSAWVEKFNELKKSLEFEVHALLVDCYVDGIEKVADVVIKANSAFPEGAAKPLFKAVS